MNRIKRRQHKAFSLVELVIVIVIIGVISAIAIPRMTRGANNAGASALKANLQVLRNAVELYRAEHEGAFPAVASFSDQMLKYTKVDGTDANVAADSATGRVYGPYLAAIPALPVSANKGNTTVAAAAATGVGWIYAESTGTISPSTSTATDQNGDLYSTY